MPGAFGDSNLLFASLLWGSVGLGFFIYGKKQQAMSPLFGGILLMGLSYFMGSALYMSVTSIAVIGAIFLLNRWL